MTRLCGDCGQAIEWGAEQEFRDDGWSYHTDMCPDVAPNPRPWDANTEEYTPPDCALWQQYTNGCTEDVCYCHEGSHEPARDMLDLVGSSDIAALARVSRPLVVAWRKRYPGFPSPCAWPSGSPVWYRSDVVAWLRTHGRHYQ